MTGLTANRGAFLPHERLIVDESPLPFVVNVKKTYDYVEPGKARNTIHESLKSPRQKTMYIKVVVRGYGRQPRLVIIFRRKGKRIREDERLAWVDTKTCMGWTNNTLKNLLTVRILRSFFYFVITSMHNANVNSRKPHMC